jgi:hypothetical protein
MNIIRNTFFLGAISSFLSIGSAYAAGCSEPDLDGWMYCCGGSKTGDPHCNTCRPVKTDPRFLECKGENTVDQKNNIFSIDPEAQ